MTRQLLQTFALAIVLGGCASTQHREVAQQNRQVISDALQQASAVVIPDAEALIITTPQEISLADVRKSIHFCRQVNMKIVGVIENMSGFSCPHCGERVFIFGKGGGKEMASPMGVPPNVALTLRGGRREAKRAAPARSSRCAHVADVSLR